MGCKTPVWLGGVLVPVHHPVGFLNTVRWAWGGKQKPRELLSAIAEAKAFCNMCSAWDDTETSETPFSSCDVWYLKQHQHNSCSLKHITIVLNWLQTVQISRIPDFAITSIILPYREKQEAKLAVETLLLHELDQNKVLPFWVQMFKSYSWTSYLRSGDKVTWPKVCPPFGCHQGSIW